MTIAVLQARMSSSRMPGKVMAPVMGEPMIWRQIERVRGARMVSKVVVATSTCRSDDSLAAFLLGRGCSVYRGDVNDLLGRFAACAAGWGAERIVRLKADRPLVDPRVIDQAVELAERSQAHYCSNVEVRTYPTGMEVEVVTAEALIDADREAVDPADRGDVTGYIRRFPLRFHQAHLTLSQDWTGLRLTVDRPEDFVLVRDIYERLYPEAPDFGLAEVLELLDERPDLRALATATQLAAA